MVAQPTSTNLERRAVVSSFLIDNSDPNQPLVALFRRSDKVRTYQGKLAPISGSISRSDESPLSAALRELQEETSLTVPDDATLHLRGAQFDIEDHQVGRLWTVHPFSFFLRKDAVSKITIDWEHTEHVWCKPEEIAERSRKKETVPRLEESFSRCWLQCGSVLDIPLRNEYSLAAKVQAQISRLRSDHQSGARQMAGHALEYLEDIVNVLVDLPNTANVWRHTLFAAWHLIFNGRPSMNAAISTTLLECLHAMSKSKYPLQAIKAYQESREVATHKIGTEFCTILTNVMSDEKTNEVNIVTLSSSSTFQSSMAEVLMYLPKSSRVNISILESRPLFEGVSLAGKLMKLPGSERLRITLAPDSSIFHLLSTSNSAPTLVVIGADRILPNGWVSNKSGSLPLLLTARHWALVSKRKVMIVVLSESEKISREGSLDVYEEESNDPVEVSSTWADLQIDGVDAGSGPAGNSQVAVVNKYFEWVPSELIDLYVTNKGVLLSDTQIREQSRRITELESEIFGQLAVLDPE